MRLVSLAIAAVLTASIVTPSLAATTKRSTAASSSYASARSFDSCVKLAKVRGFARSDLSDNGSPARQFVRRCMQGRQN